MLNKKIALLGAAAAAMVSTGANAATVTAQAEADIVAAVVLTEDVSLDLGVAAASPVAGTVVLPTGSNVRSCTGGVVCVGTAQRAQFTVSNATSGYNVNISLPASISLTSGGNSMPLALASSSAGFASTGADFTFFVGGTLTVAANQPAGTYTGSYAVSADYQ